MNQYSSLKLLILFTLIHISLFGHGVATGDQGYIQQINGINFIPFMLHNDNLWDPSPT